MNKNHRVGFDTREYLQSKGFPYGDNVPFQESKKRYENGGQYGIEIASMQTPEIMKLAIKFIKELAFKVNRFTETRGVFRLSDKDIIEMTTIANEENIGLVLSVGPRAFYDVGASSKTTQGARVSYRLRGMDNIVYAIEDVKRAVNLGVRGILVYDEGLLNILNVMKIDGILPSDLYLKVSVHCGHANPVSAKLLEDIGANSVNVIGDLNVSHIASIRQAINIPIDIHTDTPASSGGFIRTYDVPDLIRIGSPIMFKSGAISSPSHAHLPSEKDVYNRIYQAFLVSQMIQRYYPEAEQIKHSELCVPIPEILFKTKEKVF